MESRTWIRPATSMTIRSDVAGGGNTDCPRRIAEVKRASRKNISGKSSVNVHHRITCDAVATVPATIPAASAARQFNDGGLGGTDLLSSCTFVFTDLRDKWERSFTEESRIIAFLISGYAGVNGRMRWI